MRKVLILSAVICGLAGCATERVEITNPQAVNEDNSPNVRKQPEPNWTEAAEKRLSLGLQYLEQGNTARAKANLDKALKYKPDLPEVQYGMGYYYQRVNEPGLAEERYKRAISLAPRNGKALNIYGAFLCEQGRYKDAEEYFMQAVKAPDYNQQAGTLENAGLCALKAGDKALAESHFNKSLSYNPEQARALVELGNLALEKGNLVKAQGYFKSYQLANRPTPSSLLLGIQLARLTGDKDAYASYSLLLTRQFPQSDEAKQFLRSGASWPR